MERVRKTMDNNSNIMSALGYIFPSTSNQLEDFELIHKDYDYKGNEKCINPKRILRRLNDEKNRKNNANPKRKPEENGK